MAAQRVSADHTRFCGGVGGKWTSDCTSGPPALDTVTMRPQPLGYIQADSLDEGLGAPDVGAPLVASWRLPR